MDQNQGIKIKTAKRTIERKQQKTLLPYASSYLVELITNSDDSYKKIESQMKTDNEKNSVKIIYIKLEKNKKNDYVFSVIDNAEGLSSKSIEKIFGCYGEENCGGSTTSSRGLFGQGASDVMKNAAHYGKEAQIESIFNGEISKYQWRFDEDSGDYYLQQKKIDIRLNQINDFRKKIMIPFNGTKMTFGIPQTIKFKPKTIVDELNGEFTLRNILSANNRKVVFIDLNNEQHILSSNKFLLKKDNLMYSKKFNFEFDSHKFNCLFDVYKNPEKNQQGEEATKILIVDSNGVVYSNTMFNWDKHPKTKNISAILCIDGFYDYCRDKLYSNTKEEIVYDDRSGINEKTDFYKFLSKNYINKFMSECLDSVENNNQQIEISKDKKIKDTVNLLNKLFRDETKTSISGGSSKGKTPPSDGFDFPRTRIQITEGKTYSLDLIINPNQIKENDDILIEAENNNANIEFNEVIQYNLNEVNDGIVVKQISIKALKPTLENNCVILSASYNNYHKTILIQVVKEKIIYPNNGLEFEYSESTFTESSANKQCPLWFDTTLIPIGTKINFLINGMELLNDTYVLSNSEIVSSSENIGCVFVKLKGGILGNDYQLIATTETGIKTSTKILIRNAENNKSGTGGFINSIKLWDDESTTSFQILYDEKSKTIFINPYNEINKTFMPDLPNKDPNNPKFKQSEYVFLNELFSYQFAICDVKELERKNQITINKNDYLDSYLEKIDEKKELAFKKINAKK